MNFIQEKKTLLSKKVRVCNVKFRVLRQRLLSHFHLPYVTSGSNLIFGLLNYFKSLLVLESIRCIVIWFIFLVRKISEYCKILMTNFFIKMWISLESNGLIEKNFKANRHKMLKITIKILNYSTATTKHVNTAFCSKFQLVHFLFVTRKIHRVKF